MNIAADVVTLNIGIIGDGFMQRAFFVDALSRRLESRSIRFKDMQLDWPLRGQSTKRDPSLPVAEFVGRPEDYFGFLADLDVLVTHLAPITAESLKHAPGLRIIAVSRGGPVNIEMAAAHERGITVVNTPGRSASAVAEFTVASLLAETRNLIRGHQSVASGEFRREFYHFDHTGPELCELTVGIVGFGAIGARFLLGASDDALARDWIVAPEEVVEPGMGPVADYAETKFALFSRLVDATAPQWQSLSAVRDLADNLMETRPT